MNTTHRKSPLTRFLSLFTEVREGEAGTALLLTLNIFLILAAYYFIRPVREVLILTGGGAELKSYATAGQSILLLGALPLYAALASRFPRRQLINYVTLFFIGCIGLFYVLAVMQVTISIVFYLWVGIFSLMVIAQFWSFANDIYTREEGTRLFPLLVFGMSSGAVVGSFFAGRLIELGGVYHLLLVAGALLGASLVITNWVDSRSKARTRTAATEQGPAAAADADKPLKKGGAFGLVFRNRYLLLIAFMILFLNWVNTNGEYILSRTVEKAAAEAVSGSAAGELSEGEFIGKFYSDFFFYVNILGFGIQLFLVSRILKHFGLRGALLIHPLISLGAYGALAYIPLLSVIRWAKTAENATDYSLTNTLRAALFLPTTREQKYKAKQVIDTLFVRAGDLLSAGLVFAGTHWFILSTGGFAVTNLVLVGVWLVIAIAIGREYTRVIGAEKADGPTASAASAGV